LGSARLAPPAEILYRYPAAAPLIERVTSLPAYTTPDWLLTFQDSVNGLAQHSSGETVVSLLSVGVFVLACLVVRSLFRVPQGLVVGPGWVDYGPVI
jgi:hypothetical protein